MENEKNKKPETEKKPANPYNWLLSFEFFFAIAILLASATGYIVLK
jgi:hypothetical protein